MIEAVTQQRWAKAQLAEFPRNIDRREAYEGRNNALFSLLNIEQNQRGKIIVEIGCGPHPVSSFCENVTAVLIEPLDYDLKGIWIRECAEDVEIVGDEAWLFNCLQHVRDPELVIEKCKRLPTVRFFEPIDYPVSLCHPHAFTFADFRRWFGDSVKYFDGTGWSMFHDAPCAYGVWNA